MHAARITRHLIAIAVALLAGCSGTQPAAQPSNFANSEPTAPSEDMFTPIVGSVLAAPEAVPFSDGNTHLAYELIVTNVLGQSVTVDSITVEGDGSEQLRLEGDALTLWIRPMGAPTPDRTLGPGQQAFVMLDVTVAVSEEAPKELLHVLELTPETAMPPMITDSITQSIAPVAVSDTPAIVIASPVAGGGWLDGNSCCEVTPHRSAINPINGSLFAPERFAIDFVQLDASGRIFDGPNDDLKSFDYYGSDIHAVADGKVVSMGWNLPEEKPGAHPSGLELSEYGGNYIVQDIGDGNYAFYAHLQGGNPGDLAVGQELKRGDVIGQLGNSGNTDIPHLHFHVMDSPSPLGSNGVPFLIDSITLAGTVGESTLMDCMETAVPCGVNPAENPTMQETGLLYRDVVDLAL